ncbi:hypothetical protein H4R18_002796 [Coemansia javaensis]|uniref:Uncharacterized protein n=1 Tax=Coemansia javaensis TaxID=2761396 RepID=A0A9W8HFN6_9FUNG|nr:hypothetical protein H4R18_002796 [Coemansia javaensis]
MLTLPRWMSLAPAPRRSAAEAAPPPPQNGVIRSYFAVGAEDASHIVSEDELRLQAQKAHELLASIRRRHAQLGRFLEDFNMHKANPLGGPMCAEIEEKIHQLGLLIRAQQIQLKHIVDEYELGPCAPPPPCYVRYEGAVEAAAAGPDAPPSSPAASFDSTSLPITNWLAVIRLAVLKEVVTFSIQDIDRIERSPLLARFPPAGKIGAGANHCRSSWAVAAN